MARRITPTEARDLMEKEGYVYVDVRSVPEFSAGHPTGAYNVPLLHMGAGPATPNAEFMSVMEKTFPKDAKLIVGCKVGGRSARAAALLEGAGYATVAEQFAGYEGALDMTTRQVTEPGWRPANLPTSQEAAAGRSWEALQAAAKQK